MTDRELWAMVFCRALEVGTGLNRQGNLEVIREWAESVAEKALQEAPEEHP